MTPTEDEPSKVDERLLIPYEKAIRVDDAFPERTDLSYCSQCGPDNLRPLDELWVIKHHHGTQPLGHMRFYCSEHLLGTSEWVSGRKVQHGGVCPTCFQTMPLSGVCDQCGPVTP
jgi:hypothetical protein